ncbi:MAG TPA: hypothetical protein VKY26_05735, partial [Actinomycetota bacterium]|nr:hypothetical protein [Actinomycetota bacterium]
MIFVELDGLSAEGARGDVLAPQRNHGDEEQREPRTDPNDDLCGWSSALSAKGEHRGEPLLEALYSEKNEHHDHPSPTSDHPDRRVFPVAEFPLESLADHESDGGTGEESRPALATGGEHVAGHGGQ